MSIMPTFTRWVRDSIYLQFETGNLFRDDEALVHACRQASSSQFPDLLLVTTVVVTTNAPATATTEPTPTALSYATTTIVSDCFRN